MACQHVQNDTQCKCSVHYCTKLHKALRTWPGTCNAPSLLPVQEGEGEDDELHSIRRLVRDLQDEVDSEASSLPEVKVPTLGRGPSGARILQKVKAASRQNLASTAAWALSNMVANNQANQDRAR